MKYKWSFWCQRMSFTHFYNHFYQLVSKNTYSSSFSITLLSFLTHTNCAIPLNKKHSSENHWNECRLAVTRATTTVFLLKFCGTYTLLEIRYLHFLQNNIIANNKRPLNDTSGIFAIFLTCSYIYPLYLYDSKTYLFIFLSLLDFRVFDKNYN